MGFVQPEKKLNSLSLFPPPAPISLSVSRSHARTVLLSLPTSYQLFQHVIKSILLRTELLLLSHSLSLARLLARSLSLARTHAHRITYTHTNHHIHRHINTHTHRSHPTPDSTHLHLRAG